MQEEAVARGLATSGAAIRFATLVKRRAKEPALMAKMPILLTRLKRKTSSWVYPDADQLDRGSGKSWSMQTGQQRTHSPPPPSRGRKTSTSDSSEAPEVKTSRSSMSQTLCFTNVMPGCNSRYLRSTSATFDKQSTQHVMPHSLLRHFVYLHRFDGVVRAPC